MTDEEYMGSVEDDVNVTVERDREVDTISVGSSLKFKDR